MSDIGNLNIGDIRKKKEELNKTGGINTKKSVFSSEGGDTDVSNPYSMPMQPYMNRVEELANRGPLMQTRVHTQNSNDIAFSKKMEAEKTGEKKARETEVHSEEKTNVLKARPELKVFTEDVMQKGTFTPKAKEAARHFFNQISQWAGSFDDGGTGFYGSMGISNVMDCLYIDGMSLRNYLKEQYFYKTTGNPAQDEESVRNYVALIAARGEHLITLVRPNVKGDEAGVEYKNMYVDLSEVGEAESRKAKSLKEKGNQVRSDMRKRMDKEMTERTGRAYRKAYGQETDGFKRLDGAKDGITEAGGDDSEEYRAFSKSFENYNGGMQKLGLKPGRDDITKAAAEELKKRCGEALRAADEYLRSGSGNKAAIAAVEKAKKALTTDMELLDKAISSKLVEEGARMRMDELFDSTADDKPDDKAGDSDDKGDPDSSDQVDAE